MTKRKIKAVSSASVGFLFSISGGVLLYLILTLAGNYHYYFSFFRDIVLSVVLIVIGIQHFWIAKETITLK